MTLYVHIGLHKTGSSAIQTYLYSHRHTKPIYLDFGEANQSVPLFTMFASAPEQYHIWKSRGFSRDEVYRMRDRYFERFQKQLDELDCAAVISGEDLSGLDEEGVRRFYQYIHRYVRDSTIIAYVRDPLQFAKSSFSEYLKHNRVVKEALSPSHRFRLERYLNVFGKENLQVFDYGKCVNEYGSIVSHFLEVIGCEDVGNCNLRSNVSLSFEALKYLKLFNEVIPVSDRIDSLLRARHQLIARLQRLYEDFPGLAATDVGEFADYSDSEWLSEEFGITYVADAALVATESRISWDAFDEQSLSILRSHLENSMSIQASQFSPSELVTLLWYEVLTHKPEVAQLETRKSRFRFTRRLKAFLSRTKPAT